MIPVETTVAPEIADPASGIEPDRFRSVLRQQANTVTVVTAGRERPAGFCATSFVSLSLDPPLVSFAVGRASSCHPALQTAQHVLVHLLADDQEELARRFARSGEPRFGPQTPWHRGPFGLPRIDGVLAWLALVVVHRLDLGDHTLIVGRVEDASHDPARRPLLHHDGRFTRLTDPADRAVDG